MSEQREFTTRIGVDDDASEPLQEIARQQRELAETIEAAGQTAQATATAQQDLAKTTKATGEAAATSATAQRGLGDQAAAAAQRLDRQGQTAASLRTRLRDLQRQEQAHQAALARGVQVSQQDLAAGRQRQERIERITAALRVQESAQDAATTATGQSARHTGAAADAVDQKTQKLNLMARTLDRVRTAAMGWAASMIGMGGITLALRAVQKELDAVNERLEKNARLAQEAMNATTDLAFLSGMTPERIEQVRTATTDAGRPIDEGMRTFANLANRRRHLDFDQQLELYEKILETSLTTSAPLQAVANAMLTIQVYEEDPQKSANMLNEAVNRSGATLEELSPLIGQYMGIGEGVGRMSTGESLGAIAGSTVLGMDRSRALTGLESITAGMMSANMSDQAKAVIQRGQIDTSSFTSAMQTTVDALEAGRITLAELEVVIGRSGMPVMSVLSSSRERFGRFMDTLRAVEAAGQTDRNLVGEAIDQVYADHPGLQLDLNRRRAEEQEVDQRANSIHAQHKATAKAALSLATEQAVEAGQITPGDAKAMIAAFDHNVSYGMGFEEAAWYASQKRSLATNWRRAFWSTHTERQTRSRGFNERHADVPYQLDLVGPVQAALESSTVVQPQAPAQPTTSTPQPPAQPVRDEQATTPVPQPPTQQTTVNHHYNHEEHHTHIGQQVLLSGPGGLDPYSQPDPRPGPGGVSR